MIRCVNTSKMCDIYDFHVGDYENRAGICGLLDAAISVGYYRTGFDAV